MKKIIMAAILVIAGMTAFAAGLKPNEGYLKLKWGTSTDDAKKAGYTLSDLGSSDKEFIKQNYADGVTSYSVTSKDKTPTLLTFYYYMGRLFQVTEMLPENQSSREKLEKRYGKFSEIGVFEIGEQFACVEVTKEGGIGAWWLVITKNPSGGLVVNFFDWNIFKNVSELGKQLAGNDSNAGNSFVGELSDLAEKLVQDGSGKPTYAFLALTSDDGNALVENYVTDALTEAMFNTGKIKIVERASIEKILSEQQFQDSALVNENTASEIGNLTGANYVCYGTVKDLGNQVTLNVKVVEVSTAELCSMGRETVAKDEYLSGVGFEARKAGGIAKKGSSTNSIANKNFDITKSKWEVKQNRNEFDEYTTYTFICRTTTGQFLFVGYDKYDKSIYSLVRVGFYWSSKPDSVSSYDGQWGAVFDVKTESGDILKYDLSNSSNDNKWSYKTGWKKGNDDIIQITWTKNLNQKELLEIFGSNKILSIRNEKYQFVKHFETEYFWETLEANGITKEELFAAIDNEKF
jgi:TolB-like protein